MGRHVVQPALEELSNRLTRAADSCALGKRVPHRVQFGLNLAARGRIQRLAAAIAIGVPRLPQVAVGTVPDRAFAVSASRHATDHTKWLLACR